MRPRWGRRVSAADGDAGASLVEFALLLPVFMMLVLGMFSGGSAYNKRQSLTFAAREGARYGSTIPSDQSFSSGTWAQNVRDLIVARSAGDLTAAQVCVSLVQGSGGSLAVVGATPSDYSTNGGSPCIASETYPVTATDSGRRVQVSVSKPATIEALVFNYTVTLRSHATARSETNS